MTSSLFSDDNGVVRRNGQKTPKKKKEEEEEEEEKKKKKKNNEKVTKVHSLIPCIAKQCQGIKKERAGREEERRL